MLCCLVFDLIAKINELIKLATLNVVQIMAVNMPMLYGFMTTGTGIQVIRGIKALPQEFEKV
jgi:hypothetical protein